MYGTKIHLYLWLLCGVHLALELALLTVVLQERRVKYAINVTKFDRLSYKPRPYNLVVTTKAVYVLYPETFKLNTRIDFQDLLVKPQLVVCCLPALLFACAACLHCPLALRACIARLHCPLALLACTVCLSVLRACVAARLHCVPALPACMALLPLPSQ